MRGYHRAAFLAARASAAGSAGPCRRPARCAVSIRRRAVPARSASSAAAATVALPVAGSSIRPLDPGKEHPRLQVAWLLPRAARRAYRDRRATAPSHGNVTSESPPMSGLGPPQRVARGQLHHQERQPHRNDLRRMPVGPDIGCRQRSAGCGLLGAELASACSRGCGAVSSAPTALPSACRISTGTRPCALLEPQPRRRLCRLRRQHEGGADIGMARERAFRRSR